MYGLPPKGGQQKLSPFFCAQEMLGISSDSSKLEKTSKQKCLLVQGRAMWPDKNRLHLWDRFDRIRTVASCHISFVNEERTRATWSFFMAITDEPWDPSPG